ncbi:hypothetical protein AB5I41_27555 [Sphingomonas sp. MMS24-JH45]
MADRGRGAIHRDFAPTDLRAAAAGTSLAGAVLVQSQPTDVDTDWMLALAAREPLVRAVVGWVDMVGGARSDLWAGTRPADAQPATDVEAIDDTEWLLGDALTPAIRR